MTRSECFARTRAVIEQERALWTALDANRRFRPNFGALADLPMDEWNAKQARFVRMHGIVSRSEYFEHPTCVALVQGRRLRAVVRAGGLA